jgi:membrane-bound lytic murein transglycosylase B
MGMDRASYTSFLRRLADSLEQMTDLEFDAFMRGERDVHLKPPVRRKLAQQILANKPSPEEVARLLQEAKTREEGAEILKSLRLSRGTLAAIARARSIHLAKEDKLSRIEEKLIEGFIGSRLSSQAIRGD